MMEHYVVCAFSRNVSMLLQTFKMLSLGLYLYCALYLTEHVLLLIYLITTFGLVSFNFHYLVKNFTRQAVKGSDSYPYFTQAYFSKTT